MSGVFSRETHIGGRGTKSNSRMSWLRIPIAVNTASWAFWFGEEAIRTARCDAGKELPVLAVKAGKNVRELECLLKNNAFSTRSTISRL